MRWVAYALIAGLLIAANASAAEFYVSPTAAAGGNGSIGNPWRLQTAFNQPASVHAGDTIWLRGGTYDGQFTSNLHGAAGAGNQIIVRQYPGERATLRGSAVNNQSATLYIAGSYVWFWGFEITTAGANRVTAETGSWPDDIDFAGGVNTGNNVGEGTGCKLIDLVVHDTCQALSLWVYATDFETNGCIVYHNGWDAPDRGHGHGVYTQNDSGIKLFKDNILFGGFAYGTQAYGSATAYVNNFTFDGNTYFNSGILSAVSGGSNLLIGGGRPSQNIIANNNMIYSNGVSGSGLLLGYAWTDGTNVNCSAENNYLASGLTVNHYQTVKFRNNTVVGDSGIATLDVTDFASQPAYDWDANHFYCKETQWQPFAYYTSGGNYGLFFPDWKTRSGLDANSTYVKAFPTTAAVFVRKSDYDAARGTITVFNWPQGNSVSADVSAVLANGDTYEVRDAQDFFGIPVATGAYAGGTISIPMTGTTAAQPTGNAPLAYTHTSKQFGAFVLIKTGTAPTPPAAPTGLTASDGTHADKVLVTWDATAGASSYKVFRNTANNSGAAGQIGTPTANSFDDTTASVGTTYYYWVKASNSFGDSGFSGSDTGYRRATPDDPTGLTASDGTYADKVAVAWTAAASATSYKVFRNATNDSGTATQIGAPTGTSFDDVTAVAGTTYYYWTKARNTFGDSGFSNADSGYRLAPPVAPAGLAASDGTYTSHVSVTWNSVSDATSYKVFRHTANDSAGATQIGAPATNSYNDATAAAGTTYYYWAKATNAAGDSGFSNSDSGSRSTLKPFTVYVEAESGLLARPMEIDSDPTASGEELITTTVAQSGTAQYTVDVPGNGDYVVWGRVYCPDGSADSYYVSVDGGAEDVYDMAEGIWAPAWQWTVVNGRGSGAPDSIHPRLFTLAGGEHTFTFRGREIGSKLDCLCFTNVLDYVPDDIDGPPAAVNDSVTTVINQTALIAVLDNDNDPDDEALTVESVTTPQHGEATINPDNTITYTPPAGYVGQDSFDYTVCDSRGATGTATVTIAVTLAPHALTVESQPIGGVAVCGAECGGMTPYARQRPVGTNVTLTAPSMVLRGGKVYYFVRWTIDGVAQAGSKKSASFAVTGDTSAAATYRSVRLLKIYGPSAIAENGRASYRCTAFFTQGASKTVTTFASWSDNASWLRFAQPGLLQAGSVARTMTRRITATYDGVTANLNVTTRNR